MEKISTVAAGAGAGIGIGPQTYFEATKRILVSLNANIRDLTNSMRLPPDDQTPNYTPSTSPRHNASLLAAKYASDIVKCMEALSKLYELPEAGITRVPPQIPLALENPAVPRGPIAHEVSRPDPAKGLLDICTRVQRCGNNIPWE